MYCTCSIDYFYKKVATIYVHVCLHYSHYFLLSKGASLHILFNLYMILNNFV